MKAETRLYLCIVCVIVLFDVAGSFASRSLRFDYTKLVWISWSIYTVAGYFGFAHLRLVGGALAGLVAGLADSTIGWALSAAIRPCMAVVQPHFSVPLIAGIIVFVSVQGAFFGFIGGLFRLLVTGLRKGQSLS